MLFKWEEGAVCSVISEGTKVVLYVYIHAFV
jgi:hypothetical protein